MTLSDYLDALTTVREKLTALFMILLEFCTQPAMCLTESEEAGRASRTNSSSGENAATSLLQVPSAVTVVENGDDDKIKSESEVKGVLQDQVTKPLPTCLPEIAVQLLYITVLLYYCITIQDTHGVHVTASVVHPLPPFLFLRTINCWILCELAFRYCFM